MKTTPMKHQSKADWLLANNPEFYALACEQGTGKTWMLLNDIERQFNEGRINGALVLAPKGVHSNWVRREIPTHMSVDSRAGYWLAGLGKRAMRKLEKTVFEGEPDELTILAMNIDAINTAKGYDFAMRFLKSRRCMMIVDESRRIKDPTSKRTKKALALGDFTTSRRIASGTIIANGPLDAFGQYQFLRNGLLGTTSYRAFVSEYAELLPAESHVVQHTAGNMRGGARFNKWNGGKMPPVALTVLVDVEYDDGDRKYFAQAGDLNWEAGAALRITGWRKARNPPQIVKRDNEGMPVFRNLEKLRRKIEPYTYRVLKEDCLDLPPKIYQVRNFELTPAMRREYDAIESNMRYEFPDGEIDMYNALTLVGKLQQAARGFVYRDGEATPFVDPKDNPALQLLSDTLEDVQGKFIIWAARRVEIDWINDLLKAKGIECVNYHGGIKDADRDAAIDAFQDPDSGVQGFVGTPAAGGTGLTLTAATTAIYYSDDFDLEARLQSEDRNHRKGTVGDCVYIDLVATDTKDERIAASHQAKSGTAKHILGS